MHCIIFRLAGEYFGVDVDHVLEVLKVPKMNAFPKAPSFVEGVVTVRGHSIIAVDLRMRLELGGEDLGAASHMMVSRVEGLVVGLLVDGVDDVLEIGERKVDSVANISGSLIDGKLINGVAHYEGRNIMLLNLTEILGHEERDTLRSLDG